MQLYTNTPATDYQRRWLGYFVQIEINP